MHRGLPEDVERLLSATVSFDSVDSRSSGKPDAERMIGDYLEGLARAWQLETRRLPVPGHADNVLVLLRVDPAAPWLLFVSHMDTVAVEGMTIDPFSLKLVEGRLYGRGACDTKGSGAAMLWALKQYAQGSSGRPNNIALLFSVNEESGMKGIWAFIEQALPELDFRPYGAIVGEPTLLQPVVANNGSLRLTIHTEGKAAHSSDPEQGRSAVSDMARLIVHLEDGYVRRLATEHPLTGRAQCSINVIRGGSASNIVPAHCCISLDRRLVPGEDLSAVQAEITGQIESFQRARPGARVRVESEYSTPPLTPIDRATFYAGVQSVLAGCKIVAELKGVPFGTEAGVLSLAGIPSVVLGPGDVAQAHTKDEWLLQDQLHKAVEVYGALMRAPLPGENG